MKTALLGALALIGVAAVPAVAQPVPADAPPVPVIAFDSVINPLTDVNFNRGNKIDRPATGRRPPRLGGRSRAINR